MGAGRRRRRGVDALRHAVGDAHNAAIFAVAISTVSAVFGLYAAGTMGESRKADG